MTARNIPVADVAMALASARAEIIEDYPNDPSGLSCLILGFTAAGQPLHIQFTHPPRVAVITVYEPSPGEWLEWKVRIEDPT